MLTGIDDLSALTLSLVLMAGFAAGWIDAVVGGGGLLQLPVLLMVPGITPVQALATNKAGSIFGTAMSSVTYYRRVHPDVRTALPMALIALCGSVAGALLAVSLPQSIFKPIIVLALVGVALFTAFTRGLGQSTLLRFHGRHHYLAACGIGVLIGVYDGLLGPGTGSFLVIALVALLGYGFLEASAQAKIVNLATNLGALLFFSFQGSVLWTLGLLLGLANMAGGYLGVRTAVAKGSRFIRVVFLIVVTVLILKLSWDIVSDLLPALPD